MKYLRAFFMCLGMFTAIPCPWRPYDEDARGLMLAMLPPVGLVVGALWVLLGQLGLLLPAIRPALITSLPWLLTGFIHLDGYMDTCDALLSWRPLEKRLEILKDSHTGAFAVVGLVVLAMFSRDAASSLDDLRILLFIPVVSRCGSALSVLCLKPLGHSQYARMVSGMGQRMAVAAIWLATLAAAFLWLRARALALIVESIAYAAAMAWGYRTLQGVSGDVAGFALTVAECAALAAAASL